MQTNNFLIILAVPFVQIVNTSLCSAQRKSCGKSLISRNRRNVVFIDVEIRIRASDKIIQVTSLQKRVTTELAQMCKLVSRICRCVLVKLQPLIPPYFWRVVLTSETPP